jgi:hypothetical protein
MCFLYIKRVEKGNGNSTKRRKIVREIGTKHAEMGWKI